MEWIYSFTNSLEDIYICFGFCAICTLNPYDNHDTCLHIWSRGPSRHSPKWGCDCSNQTSISIRLWAPHRNFRAYEHMHANWQVSLIVVARVEFCTIADFKFGHVFVLCVLTSYYKFNYLRRKWDGSASVGNIGEFRDNHESVIESMLELLQHFKQQTKFSTLIGLRFWCPLFVWKQIGNLGEKILPVPRPDDRAPDPAPSAMHAITF